MGANAEVDGGSGGGGTRTRAEPCKRFPIKRVARSLLRAPKAGYVGPTFPVVFLRPSCCRFLRGGRTQIRQRRDRNRGRRRRRSTSNQAPGKQPQTGYCQSRGSCGFRSNLLKEALSLSERGDAPPPQRAPLLCRTELWTPGRTADTGSKDSRRIVGSPTLSSPPPAPSHNPSYCSDGGPWPRRLRGYLLRPSTPTPTLPR